MSLPKTTLTNLEDDKEKVSENITNSIQLIHKIMIEHMLRKDAIKSANKNWSEETRSVVDKLMKEFNEVVEQVSYDVLDSLENIEYV